jgi:methionyl-tRNA formyltransferase
MRIIVNGQQAFGKAVLEALLERGEDVVAVYSSPDKEGRPPDPLKVFAEEKGLPVYQPASFKKPEVWDEMRALEPDLGVMAYVTLFVPAEVRDMPTHGTARSSTIPRSCRCIGGPARSTGPSSWARRRPG